MISIQRNGQNIHLPKSFTIDIEFNYDLLEFDQISQTYSWPITLARQGNEIAFDFPHDITNPNNSFGVYEGYQITFNGEVWYNSSLKIEKANDYYITGTFTEIDLSVNNILSLNLGDIIDYSLDIDTNAKDLNQYALQDGVVFPVCALYNELRLSNHISSDLVSPWYPLKNVLRLALKSVGYQLIDDFTGDKFAKLIIASNKIPTNSSNSTFTINFSESLPNITFSKLLKSIAELTTSQIIIDFNTKTLRISSFDQVQYNTYQSIDLTEIEVQQPEYDGYVFSYNYEHDRFINELTSAPTTKEIEDIIIYNTLQEAPIDLNKNQLVYIKAESAFYKNVNPTFRQAPPSYLYPAILSEDKKNIKNIEFEILTVPPPKTKHTYKTYEISNVRNENSNALFEIEEVLINLPFSSSLDNLKIKINYSDQKPPLGYGYQAIESIIENTSQTGTLTVTLTSTISTISISRIESITIRCESNMYFPLIGSEPDLSTNDEVIESDTYICFYRGIHQTIDGANAYIGETTQGNNEYQYASLDHLSPSGSIIGDINLDTFSDQRITMHNTTSLKDIVSLKQIESVTYLTPTQINNLKINPVFYYRNTKMLLKNIKFRISENGIVNQILSAYLLTN